VAAVSDKKEIMGSMTAPLWIGGTAWLLVGRERGRYSVFGWTFVTVLGAFIALKGKNYYVTPIYPMVFAAGAIAFEEVTASRNRRWVRTFYAAAMAVLGLALLPMVVPVLSPKAFIGYEKWLRLTLPASEHQDTGPLPQYFADEFGWEDMVRQVARVYHGLSLADQKRTAIYSNDWGEAAAIDFFGPKYGLPRAICRHNSYWSWGPRDYTGEIVIVLRSDGSGDRRSFASVEKVGRVEHPYSRRDDWFDIFLCRGLKFDLRQKWPKMKAFG